jgi:predicted nucleic acid-binding protein
MSGERIFLDTNILIYAYDRTAGRKHEIAKALMIELWNADGGVLSTQVLQEFYVTATKKVACPMPPEEAKEIVVDFLSWDVVTNDGEAVVEAIDLQTAEKISFWDALIVAASRKGAASVLLSEDLADGRKFGDILVRNPFARS